MKLISTLFLLCMTFIGYSQNYSLSTTAQYSFGQPMIGISGIMEQRQASFQTHVLFSQKGNVEASVKLGLNLSKQTKARFVVYPAYLKYDVTNNKYVTPIGFNCISTFGDLTTNIGIDILKKKDEETNDVKYFFLNASINYTLFGSRY